MFANLTALQTSTIPASNTNLIDRSLPNITQMANTKINQIVNTIILHEPGDYKGCRQLALSAYAHGKIEAAFEAAEEFLFFEPNDREIQNLMLQLLNAKGEYQKIIHLAQTILQRDPSNERALAERSNAALKIENLIARKTSVILDALQWKNWQEVIFHANCILQLQVNHTVSLFCAGTAYFKLGLYEEAFIHLLPVYSLDHLKTYHLCNMLAQTALKLNMPSNLVNEFITTSLQLKPANTPAMYLARCVINSKMFEGT